MLFQWVSETGNPLYRPQLSRCKSIGNIVLVLQRQLGEWVAASFVAAESCLALSSAAPG
jgi:hypothetical protein